MFEDFQRNPDCKICGKAIVPPAVKQEGKLKCLKCRKMFKKTNIKKDSHIGWVTRPCDICGKIKLCKHIMTDDKSKLICDDCE